MILLAGSEGPDQPARMRRLIWAFAVRISPKTRFHILLLSYDMNPHTTTKAISTLMDQILLGVIISCQETNLKQNTSSIFHY